MYIYIYARSLHIGILHKRPQHVEFWNIENCNSTEILYSTNLYSRSQLTGILYKRLADVEDTLRDENKPLYFVSRDMGSQIPGLLGGGSRDLPASQGAPPVVDLTRSEPAKARPTKRASSVRSISDVLVPSSRPLTVESGHPPLQRQGRRGLEVRGTPPRQRDISVSTPPPPQRRRARSCSQRRRVPMWERTRCPCASGT